MITDFAFLLAGSLWGYALTDTRMDPYVHAGTHGETPSVRLSEGVRVQENGEIQLGLPVSVLLWGGVAQQKENGL